MPHISISVSENEKILMENYASLHGLSLTDTFKLIFFEKLEDEYDIETIMEYESESETKMYSHEEVGKILGLK